MFTYRLGASMLAQLFLLDNLLSALCCTALPMCFEGIGQSHQRLEGSGGLVAVQQRSVAGGPAASPGAVQAFHLYGGKRARGFTAGFVSVRDMCSRSTAV